MNRTVLGYMLDGVSMIGAGVIALVFALFIVVLSNGSIVPQSVNYYILLAGSLGCFFAFYGGFKVKLKKRYLKIVPVVEQSVKS